jgi:hypothetical protein
MVLGAAWAADPPAPQLLPVPQAVVPWKRQVFPAAPATVPMASIPRLGSLAHPDPATVSTAVIPHIGSVAHPDPATVALAIIPHIGTAAHPDPAQVATAVVPYLPVQLSNGLALIEVPPRDLARVMARRGLGQPEPNIVPLATVPRIRTPVDPDSADVATAVVPYLPVQLSSGLALVEVPPGDRTRVMARRGLGQVEPSSVSLATIPNLRIPAQPEPAEVAAAMVPYLPLQQANGLTLVEVSPWPLVPAPVRRGLTQPEPSTVGTAEVPLAYIASAGRGGQPYLVAIPPGQAPATFQPRDLSAPAPAALPLAEVSFDNPEAPRRSAPHSPLAAGRADQDKFIVSLIRDPRGRVWIGTEDQGVWCYDPAAPEGKQWHGYSVKDGLGDDNAYALTCDLLGRIWVGHLNHGVSVFNGAIWKNYDVIDGPLGERVFALATNPADGDVWIATNAGLTRYSYKKDSWSYYTRAAPGSPNGLPSDQAGTLAFAPDGTLYVGTQCDGIAIGHAADDYQTWQIIHAAKEYQDRVPLVPTGQGLPTDLINQILVAHDGTVYAATTTGLAWSKDQGQTWQFTRGQEWAEKVHGLYGGPPKGWKEPSVASGGGGVAEMLEDYLTCLAEDEFGGIWIGTRQKGYEVLDTHSAGGWLHQYGPPAEPGRGASYISALLPRPTVEGPPLIGQYQGGLVEASAYFRRVGQTVPPVALEGNPACPLPSPAKPPTAEELAGMLAKLRAIEANSPPSPQPLVVALPDDWRTQGDWLGRYGRYWACCCAICSPHDYIWGAGKEPVPYFARIDPRAKGDVIRYWVHWMYTEDHRSLEMPPTYLHSRVLRGETTWGRNRRQAEWDDHGEAYPLTYEGPDEYCTLKVPAGLFFLSLYDFNKDGHTDVNRLRDYRVSIRAHDASKPLYDTSGFEAQPELAQARVRDFWGGVWKRFLVRGPVMITVRVERNYSLNAILAGVMLDLVDEQPEPYFNTSHGSHISFAHDGHDGLPTSQPDSAKAMTEADHGIIDAAGRLLMDLAVLRSHDPARWAAVVRQRYIGPLRYWRASGVPATDSVNTAQLGTCYYELALYPQWERCQVTCGLTTARDIEKSLRWDMKPRPDGADETGYETVTTYLDTRAHAGPAKEGQE